MIAVVGFCGVVFCVVGFCVVLLMMFDFVRPNGLS